MPVYLLTYHAYQSWMPDHPRGYTRRDEGVLPPDSEMSKSYRRLAHHEEIVFTERHQRIILDTAIAFCAKDDVRVHYIVTVDTHAHVLLSWKDHQVVVDRVYSRLKQSLGFSLASEFSTKGCPYFSKGGGDDRKPVRHRDHFDHLMNVYMPDHAGVTWSETQDKRRPAG